MSLENLAVDFCVSFLEAFYSPDNKNMKKIIELHGAKDEILFSLINYMQTIFLKKNEEVEIILGKEGYNINVGGYL